MMVSTNKCLLIGIGGVYNYGCEAIVRGTESILRYWYPNIEIIYASRRVEDDKRRLCGCNVKIENRQMIGRYHLLNITRKILSEFGSKWQPICDNLKMIDGCSAVLSIGGDIYTVYPDGTGPESLMKFGDACENKGVPYILWAASLGPFESQPRLKKKMLKHLTKISSITVRENVSKKYLIENGVINNVKKCADPAFIVGDNYKKDSVRVSSRLRIGINLSPLSAMHGNYTLESASAVQAKIIENIIEYYDASIVLIPHVVCDFYEYDDDKRYLERIYLKISAYYRHRVTMLYDDPGFIGLKDYLIECDMIMATRMHCAINAVSSHVPAIFISYSSKAVGMSEYIYGNSLWLMSFNDFMDDIGFAKIKYCMNAINEQKKFLKKRMEVIRSDVYGERPPLGEFDK